MLLETLAASILENALAGRGLIKTGEGVLIWLVKTFNAASFLTNLKFEIQKYHQCVPKFNSVYSPNNLSKIKDSAYITNLNKNESIGIHWIDFVCGC